MSAKNKLQEWCQKHKYALPTYVTTRAGGDDHSPLWLCKLSIPEEDINVTSPFSSRKADAEAIAATMAFQFVQKVCEEEITQKNNILDDLSICDEYKDIYLVDIENVEISKMYLVDSDELYIGVLGHCCKKSIPEFITHLYTIKSSVKDAADHAITFLAGIISTRFPDKKIFVVSSDHFAEATVRCLESVSTKAEHLTKLS